MRAVVYDRYGPPDVLRLEDVERPAPKEDEVLVKICAAAVTRGRKYRAVIDRWYPLEGVVEATRYVETEQKTGNVVLTIIGGGARSERSSGTRTAHPMFSSSRRSISQASRTMSCLNESKLTGP
jgi:hypothetical protein